MIRSILLSLLLVMAMASPALAHKLKVFAAVEGDAVAGYAFFIGGGRAQDTDWTAKSAGGEIIGKGRTGPEGEFRVSVPAPVTADITVTVNTKEGHIASTTLAAARFGADLQSAAASDPAPQTPATQPPAAAASLPPDAETAALVEAAVQRQVEPLLERIEQMDDRLRYTDILSGIFLIVGLAGIGLWAYGRRK